MDAHEPRLPAVAGRFYPGEPAALARAVNGSLVSERAPMRARAVLAPHAGYLYSGAVAGATYASVEVPDQVVVLAPNHTGRGIRRSVWSGGAWQLPGMTIPVDDALRRRLIQYCALEMDREAHLLEHAVEVHLPFLHARNPNVRVVPVVLGGLDVEACRTLGEGLARAVGEEDVLLVASSDMSHYVSAETARRLDALALDRVLALDAEGLHRTVGAHGISMCGFVPTTVVLFAARALSATTATLVRYANSGQVSDDMERVVGYAGVLIH